MLAVVLAASVMDLLDSTVVNVAAPSISAELGGGVAVVAWSSAGYTLAFGVLLVIGGRLGDRWGRRRLFLLGATGFTVASLGCGLAPTATVLILTRALQGAFGALLIPQGLGLLKAAFPPDRTGRAFAAFAPVMAIASVCGPLLAGLLIDLDLFGSGWRMIFLINLPIGVATVAAGLRWLPGDRPDPTVHVDPIGAALLALASLLTIFPLIQGPRAGWPAWSVLTLGAAAATFVGFWHRQRRAAHPIIVPTLFANRAYTAGLGFGVAFFAVVGGLLLVLPLFLQTVLHYSPLRAGLIGLPISVGVAVASILGRRFAGRRLILGGAVAVSAGAVLLAAVVDHRTGALALLGPCLLIGLGMGSVFGPLYTVILGSVGDRELGSASGSLSAVVQLASAFGVALLITVYAQGAMVLSCLVAAALALLGAGLALLFPTTLPGGRP